MENISDKGEKDKISITLEIPKKAHLKSWDTQTPIPVLLIKVKNKVRYAIPSIKLQQKEFETNNYN